MLFGCLDTDRMQDANSEACDLIIMMMNRNIYFNNYHGNQLSVTSFVNEVRAMERTEYAIAERKGKLGIHLAKWERIGQTIGYNILTDQLK